MSDLLMLRLPLERHGTELLVVGDSFGEHGRYVQIEVDSAGWTVQDYLDAYRRLDAEWNGDSYLRREASRQKGDQQ